MAEKIWQLGVLGGPQVGDYSLSPLMHAEALEKAGLQGTYQAFGVDEADLEDWLNTEAIKLDGFNVTMPYKEKVFDWIMAGWGKKHIPRKIDLHMKSVNTVGLFEGQPFGCSTDGLGFLWGFETAQVPLEELEDKKVLLLGAGGAARAIVYVLAQCGVAAITVCNRTAERAKTLIADSDWSFDKKITAPAWDVVTPDKLKSSSEYDVVINTTSLGMSEEDGLPIPKGLLKHKPIVYDIVYQPRETALIDAARDVGCIAITGENMLAGQGAQSFEIWTGEKPPFEVMKNALDAHYVA